MKNGFETNERTESVLKSNNGRKVLLAENNEQVFSEYSSALSEYGFDVLGARDGKEAVSKFINEIPDIVLLDYDLPRYCGLETASEIMEMKPSTELIIFAPSGIAALQNKVVEGINPAIILPQSLGTIKLIASVVAVADLHPTMTLVSR